MAEIIVPELGEDIAQATVVEWHISQGGQVQEGDDVVELVTDKATFNVEAPASGVLSEQRIAQGEEVAVGGILGVIN